MDDFRKIMYGVIIGFIAVICSWISFVTMSGCNFATNCASAAQRIDRTSIPTLQAATLPAPVRLLNTNTPTSGQNPSGTQVAGGPPRPSNPGGPGPAVSLIGNVDSGKVIFATNCVICHAAEGKGGNPNPGSTSGTEPALNPINPLLKSSDHTTFVTNLDLFVQHGSTPPGPGPLFSMPPWGDKNKLTQQQIADVIAYVISLNP